MLSDSTEDVGASAQGLTWNSYKFWSRGLPVEGIHLRNDAWQVLGICVQLYQLAHAWLRPEQSPAAVLHGVSIQVAGNILPVPAFLDVNSQLAWMSALWQKPFCNLMRQSPRGPAYPTGLS